MVLNTTTGPKQYDPTRPAHTINTTAVVEENLQYLDEEPEIISVLPGTGWQAVIGDEAVALVAFVALDTGRMYGVVLGSNGLIDLEDDVETRPHFSGYKQANNRQGETK